MIRCSIAVSRSTKTFQISGYYWPFFDGFTIYFLQHKLHNLDVNIMFTSKKMCLFAVLYESCCCNETVYMLAEGVKSTEKRDGWNFFVRGFGAFNNSTLFKNVLYLHQALPQIKQTAQRTMAHFTLPQSQYHMATYSSLSLTCGKKKHLLFVFSFW